MNTRFPIVMLVAAMAAACGGGQGPAKKESSAAAPAAASAAPSSPLLAMLPAKDEVPGWATAQAPKTFTADNLWEQIDGAADGFVAYGVQQMVAASFTQAATKYEAAVEIYQMKDALNAWGKYAEERNPDYQFLKVGNEGYSGGTSLNFWKGQYYVKITAFEEKDAIRQEMTKLAQAIAARVSTPGAEPPEIAFFPKQNQLPYTTRYIPKDVLAQSYFTNGFEAQYKAGKKPSKLVVILAESTAAAEDGLGRYRQVVAKSGKDVKDLKAPGDGGFTGKDSFYGTLAAVRAGKTIVVALGTATEEAGKAQIAEVVKNLK